MLLTERLKWLNIRKVWIGEKHKSHIKQPVELEYNHNEVFPNIEIDIRFASSCTELATDKSAS